MGLLPFGGGGMGFGGRKDSDKEVNLFSMSKEDRIRQRELVARQERNSLIQVLLLSGCLLVVVTAFFFFRAAGGPEAPKKTGAGATGSQESDAARLQKMLDALTCPDVRPSPEEMAPEFTALDSLPAATIAAGIDDRDLTAADAFRRNRPTPAMVAQAVQFLRTHLEKLKDFAAAPNRIALPFEAVQHPEAARGQFQTIQGVLERVEPDFYNFVTIDDPALQAACGVKALHLYYFDTAAPDRERFYYGRDVYPEPEITGSGVTAKLHKFAVLVPSDLSPVETANLADIDHGGKPKAHMIFDLRMNAIFLGNHLVLPLKLADSRQRITVPLYLAVDPLPWRTDKDKQATLGPKVKTTMAAQPHTPGALEPLPDGQAPVGEQGEDPAHQAPEAGADGGWRGGAPTAAKADDKTPFQGLLAEFKPLKELTGREDPFIGIPTGNDLESIKEAANYTHSYEAFHLCVRFLRSHTADEIHAYRLAREKANTENLQDAAKSVANYTNVRHDPEPYYGQPYEFQGWLTMCLSPRDFWEQDFGQGTGLKAESGVRHTSTWILKDDHNDYYCVTVPHSTQEVLGKEFNGDLNHLQDLNIRMKVQGLLLERLPVQKRLTLEFDTMPMYVALDLERVVRPPSTLGQYSYWVAGGLGLVFVLVLVVLYKDRKPDAVVRNKTRENMFNRLRKAGKLTPAAESAAAARLRGAKPSEYGTGPGAPGGTGAPPPSA